MALLCVACGNTFAVDDRFCRVCGRVVGPVSPVAIANVPLTPAAPAQTSGKATASLVCGLLFFIPLAFVAAIVFGHLALSEIRKSAGRLKGEGLAIAGLVLGYALDGVNSGHFDNCCDRDTEPVASADGSERIIGWGGDSADQRRRGYLLQRTHECGLHLLALRSLPFHRWPTGERSEERICLQIVRLHADRERSDHQVSSGRISHNSKFDWDARILF